MVAPAIILIVAGLLLAGTSAAVALNWDQIQRHFKGKKLAILGERGVGKTHLFTFLQTGEIPAEYKQTIGAQKLNGRRIKLRDLELDIKETLDVPGAKESYAVWRHLHNDSHIVLYLLRADKVMAGNERLIKRVKEDIRHIGIWREELEAKGKRAPRFFLVGTHCDEDPKFTALTPDTVGDYYDGFRKHKIITDLIALAGGTSAIKVVLGSMENLEHTEALVFDLFYQATL